MMSSRRKLWISTIFILFSLICTVQPTSVEAKARFSVASDPIAWLLDGYSAVVMMETDSPWRYSAEVWGFAFPQQLVELWGDNQGWTRRVDLALAVYADYHLKSSGEGFHFGVAFDAIRSTARMGNVSGSFWSLEVLPRVGYRWFVFADLFINPWFGVGPIVAVQQPPTANGGRFVEAPLQAVATAHLGWRF